MSRIRTIKPDFWRDEALSSVSAEAALLAIGLLNHSDDEGFFNANPKLIEADVFPLRELSSSITVLLRELSKIGYLTMFLGSDGKKYGMVTNFAKHQVINKPRQSKIKGLCSLPEEYGSDTVDVPLGMEWNGKGKGKEKEIEGANALDGFDEFWMIYDKKVEKPQAEKSWKRIKPTIELQLTIYAAARTYVASTPDKKYRKNPSTWLNNQCWNDEVVTEQRKVGFFGTLMNLGETQHEQLPDPFTPRLDG
jgi:hypothetical protein